MNIDPSNFGSSRSLDTLANLLEYIIKQIRELFGKDTRESIYEDSGEDIIAYVDILLTLYQHYKVHPQLFDLDEVVRWKTDFLQVFDQHIDKYGIRQEDIVIRRRIVSDTFNRLYEYVEENTY
jgi:hypothetical protein